MVSGRRHNADDLVATALAVEPVKTVYRGRWGFPFEYGENNVVLTFILMREDINLKCMCVFCRIAVFSVTVFYDERIVIVAEQRPDASEEDSFQWMSRVLQVQINL